MTLEELYKIVPDYTKVLIRAGIDTGTKETFEVEIERGGRKGGCRKEYYEWLFSLGLEVDHIGACAEDVLGNKEMLTIHCKPLKLKGDKS